MRDIGYSLSTALADIIDNSLTAGAGNINLLVDIEGAESAIGLLDDGHGMRESELLEAMRPGSRSPLEKRDQSDLGRFGLGLKTASFSQCRRLTVVSKRDGVSTAAIWDLDEVVRTDSWYVDIVDDPRELKWSDRLSSDGTLVIWEKLDRLSGGSHDEDQRNLVDQVDEAATHIELVFHRFLAGESSQPRIRIALNDRPLKPRDPFHIQHPATQIGPPEIFALGNSQLTIQAFTLPHHTNVSADEWRRCGGPEGYVKNQGFYLYRERRLIVHGTWFGLAQQKELTKLARVRIDMSNDMDPLWQIDVKKASARPPAPIRKRLKRLIDQIGAGSKRTYTRRGARLVSEDRLPVWVRNQDRGSINYALNRDHPILARFSEGLSPEQSRDFRYLLEVIESCIPIDALFADVSANPEDVRTHSMDAGVQEGVVCDTYRTLISNGVSPNDAELMMSSAEPFRSNWSNTRLVIERYRGTTVE
ncbi:ATP-binding protein [Salinisphaera orenii]|uniref:ATP-binding protein n=1 Tax=Salinisphaera orenii TaxID=856731 RepID=UPI000DBE0797